MLLTKEVEVGLRPQSIKWFESLGYKIPRWIDNYGRKSVKKGTKIIVKVEDLSSNSGVLVNVQCDCCGVIIFGVEWRNYKKCIQKNGEYYCNKCATKLLAKYKIKKTKLNNSISFYDWCYEHLSKEVADEILLRWDYKLNKLTPKEISYGSGGTNDKGYWFKCLDHPEHKSELKNVRRFTYVYKGSGIACNQCNVIAVTHPHLVKYLVDINNSLKYTIGEHKKLPIKCPDCGYEKKIYFYYLVNNRFSCSRCGDGNSYPNKIGFSVLEQLTNLEAIKCFENEKSFNWCKFKYNNKLRKGRFDFYFELNNKGYIIEMDGGFHYKDNNLNGQSYDDSNIIDNYKDRLAKENNISVIRINCEKSELEYIKRNIITSELNNLFDLSNIDWLECHEYACSSLVKVVCGLWNRGMNDISNISKELKRSVETIRKYLKQGAELGWCDYNSKKSNLKKIICLTTKEIFHLSFDIGEKYNINISGVYKCCNNKANFAGKHPKTGEFLKWMYFKDYVKTNNLFQEVI